MRTWSSAHARASPIASSVVRRYQAVLARVARSRLGRADWAEDVVQETFWPRSSRVASLRPQYSFRTWLWTILLNQCRAHYQRRRAAYRSSRGA